MIPTKPLTDLSPDAKRLYLGGVADYNRQVKIATADTDAIAAATEVAEAGYGTLHITEKYDATLRVQRIAKGFSVARRDDAPWDGHLYIEVEVLRNANDSDGALLACLYGATFEDKTSSRAPWAQWSAEVRHPTAKDADHSSAYLASLSIDHPVLNAQSGFRTEFVGILGETRIWPTGTDITLLDDHTGKPIAEPEMCTYSPHCKANPHPFGPFQPPVRDDCDRYAGRAVRITTIPLPLVGTDGMLTSRTPVTHADY